jgi:LuxR family transcriptional regulator, maltose regulon positive regulatory protein
VVERPRLVELIERGVHSPLTLISAPAGYGKTVLLRSWMAAARGPAAIAHLALTREHSDRRTFWLDMFDAIARAQPELTGVALPTRGSRSFSALRAGLDGLRDPVVLVLDDFHSIGTAEVLADVESLLERPHPALRMVLATRRDPPVRLQRLRMDGELTEIRASHLAFTWPEARELLSAHELEEADVETLLDRTEGWAAALRLAELSLHGNPEPAGFIAHFAGDDRAVTDYLTSEVLSGYDEETLGFLLRTSVVDRLNGELAELLTGVGDGQRALHDLARVDGFVEVLDSKGNSVRYHPLLAEVLRAELRHRFPDELAGLHGVAGRWHASHGNPLEGARHAVAAGDWPLAAELISDQWLVCVVEGAGGALRELAEEIPADVIEADAELALAVAGLLLETGEIKKADELLVRAYELAADLPDARRRRFNVTSTATALYRARLDGDLDEALSAARLALSEHWDTAVAVEVRALALANLGIAEFWAGDVEQALARLQAAAGLAVEFGNDYILLVAESYLAAVDARQGRLDDAHSRARTAIRLAERRGWTEVPHLAIAFAALATVHVWWNELDEAEQCGERARETLGRSPEPLLAPIVAQVRAYVCAARGDPLSALEILRGGDAGERMPHWMGVSAGVIEAELWLALGEPTRARGALEALSSAELSDSAIGIARLELALGEPEAALRAIAGFLADAREALLPVARTEAWTIDAIARDAIHDEPGALRALERALDLAEPRGYASAMTNRAHARRTARRCSSRSRDES